MAIKVLKSLCLELDEWYSCQGQWFTSWISTGWPLDKMLEPWVFLTDIIGCTVNRNPSKAPCSFVKLCFPEVWKCVERGQRLDLLYVNIKDMYLSYKSTVSEENQRRWQCGWQTKRTDREDLKEGMWIIRLCRSTYGHGRYQTEVSLGDTLGWPHILGTHTAGGQASKRCVWLFTITFS